MSFVERAKDGSIKGVYMQRQAGYAEEEVADADSELLAFMERIDLALAPKERQKDSGAVLSQLSAEEMLKVIEVVIGERRSAEIAASIGIK